MGLQIVMESKVGDTPWCIKLDIVEAPSHFLVVRLISLDSNLNMNCYILFENVC
jgi:hypothetical protein